MSRTRNSAAKPPAWRRRLGVALTGAGLGWASAWVWLAGTRLDHELQALWFPFMPFSTVAGGLAALVAWTGFSAARDAFRRRGLRAAFAALVLGMILVLGLYLRFTERIRYGDSGQIVAFILGTSRSGFCECSEVDAICIQQMGLSVDRIRFCWKNRWLVELALLFSYFLTLGSAGTFAGLLLVPARSPQAPQSPQGYLDFDVWIDQKSEGLYRAKAWSGAAGFEATESFTLPPALKEGEPWSAGDGSLRGGSVAATDSAGPKKVGDELFRTVFQGELLKAFQGCLDKAQGGPGVRIRLRLNDVPELAGLPWEYLYDAGGREFLALSGRTPVVRYLELSESLGTLLVEPPLRVLAVISTPRGYRELDEADEEWRRLCAALEPLLGNGLIEVERLPRPTPKALEARLRTGQPVHVLHFVGHGGFSELRGEGVLVFEDEDGRGVPVGGPSLAYLLQDHSSLRLAVLNACNGARASHEDTFAGTAQALVQHGVPAVIAMQSEVTDETACSFAEKFYRALADGLPVDACVGEVRRALAAERNPEWGTPVLYLRATDGRLFALEGAG